MPLNVSFTSVVLDGANVWTKGDAVDIEIIYHVETADGGERLSREPLRISSLAPDSLLNSPFDVGALPPNPTLKDVVLAMKAQIQAALAVIEGV